MVSNYRPEQLWRAWFRQWHLQSAKSFIPVDEPEKEAPTLSLFNSVITSMSATPLIRCPLPSKVMLQTDVLPGHLTRPSVRNPILSSSDNRRRPKLSSPIAEISLVSVGDRRWAASAMFLPTPPNVKETEPGMVEWAANADSPSGEACALMSIAAHPMTRRRGCSGNVCFERISTTGVAASVVSRCELSWMNEGRHCRQIGYVYIHSVYARRIAHRVLCELRILYCYLTACQKH